ncbi:hypothetical protein ABZW10_04090 [Kitasatospora sp. NPDC004723]|uniref:hypothetical protein n=1 Tax=Kitasatospora sp. NPDC004723 TaxID=3154288 RepID=UPI00339E40FB
MPKAGKPRTATVDGVQVVVLSPEQYDGLEANRRRVGGLQTLVARMKQELRHGRRLLSEVEQLLAELPAELLADLEDRMDPGRGLSELLDDVRAALPAGAASSGGSDVRGE